MKSTIHPNLSQLYKTTEFWFSEKLADFAELLTDKLVTKAEKSTVTSVQTQCFSAIHNIRANGGNSVTVFLESLRNNFQTNTIKPSLNDDLYSITHAKKNPLNLLTTKDLEDSLSYETAIEKIHKQNKEAFEHLEIRVYELLKQTSESISGSPISAENILTAFRESLDLFDFTPNIRIEVYELFEKFLSQNLPELLNSLNDILIDEGILPEIDPDYFIRRLARDNNSNTGITAEDNAGPFPDPAPQTEHTAENPFTALYSPAVQYPDPGQNQNTPPPQYNGGTIQNPVPDSGVRNIQAGSPATTAGYRSLNNRLIDLANRLSNPGNSSGVTAGPPAQPAVQTPDQTIIPVSPSTATAIPPAVLPISPAKNQQTQINSLLGYGGSGHYGIQDNSLRSLRESFLTAQNNGISSFITSSYANQYDVSTDELIEAITHIKHSPAGFQDSDPAASISQQIREEVFSGINKSPENTELKNKKLFLIDMIETLFNHICNNKNLTPTAVHLFRRLTIPVIHLSLIDDVFIDSSKHPARLFLDDFADAALGIGDDEDSQDNPLYLKLHKLIEQTSQEDRISGSFFSELHDDLKRFLQYRKQQANIKSPTSRTQIEKKIDAIILYHTQNRNVPDNMLLILNKVWKKVMLNAYFDDSHSEDEWDKAKAFVGSLIYSITPKTDVEQKRLTRLIPVVRQEFEDGLIQINLPFEQKLKLLKYLDVLHNSVLSGPDDNAAVKNKHQVENLAQAETLIPEELSSEIIEEIVIEAEQHEAVSINEQENEIQLITPADLTDSDKPDVHHRKKSQTDYELIRLATQGYNIKPVTDRYTEMVKQLEVDNWIEFHFESRFSRARITWISEDKSQFNCLTQNNHIVEFSLTVLSDTFRRNISSVIQNHSIIEEAIKSTSDSIFNNS